MAATAIVLARRLDPLSGTCLLAAAWLHDVSDVDVFHAKRSPALDSAKIARASGFDNAVVSLVAYCSGAVYEARELGLLAELTTFRRPPPKLLDALTYCDLTTDRYGFRTTADAYLEEILQGRRPDDPTHRATLAARDELLAAVARVQSWM